VTLSLGVVLSQTFFVREIYYQITSSKIDAIHMNEELSMNWKSTSSFPAM
jgi:hypothetical protein